MTLVVYVYTKQASFSEADAETFFALLNESGSDFVPKSYNHCEPIKEPYDPQTLDKPIEMLTTWGSIFLKGVSPGYLIGLKSGHPQRDRWWFDFKEPFYKDSGHCQVFVQFIQNLCRRFPPMYAIAAIEEDHKAKHCLYDPETGRSQGSRGATLAAGEGLPGIYWLNIFGPGLVEFFGRDKLLNLPDVQVTKVGEQCISVQTYATPMDSDAQWRRDREKKIVEALGPECFFDIDYYQKTKRPRRRVPIPGVTKK